MFEYIGFAVSGISASIIRNNLGNRKSNLLAYLLSIIGFGVGISIYNLWNFDLLKFISSILGYIIVRTIVFFTEGHHKKEISE